MTNPQAHGRAAHGRAVIPITRAQVDAALLLLEHVDIPAANLVRDYIDGLEQQLWVYELGGDDFDPEAKERVWERLIERIEREMHE